MDKGTTPDNFGTFLTSFAATASPSSETAQRISELNASMSALQADQFQQLLGDHPTIYVFGYGSLLWKPDFRYKSKQVGYIEGYERRFYQGNITHRGKPGQPGRVANLVERKESTTWGVAYEISGREDVTQALHDLYNRETASGYVTLVTTFFPREVRDSKRRMTTTGHTRTSTQDVSSHEASDSDSDSGFSSDGSFCPSLNPGASLRRVDSDLSDVSSDDDGTDDDVLSGTGPKISFPVGHTNGAADKDLTLLQKCECGRVDQFSIASDQVTHSVTLLQKANRMDVEEPSPVSEIETSIRRDIGASAVAKKHDQYCDVSSSFSASVSSKSNRIDIQDNFSTSISPLQVLVYTATADNDLYLGPDDVTVMARQIVSASGDAGSNVEYVTKIADYVRKYIPEDDDVNLFHLDAKVREEVYRRHARDSTFDVSDLVRELHALDFDSLVEPVLAS